MKRSASTSTLARLSFWIPPERLSEFEIVYEQRLAPILKKHGLVESAERGRPTAEGIFSRLFEVESPPAVPEMERAFHQDPAWQEALSSLGISFGTADPGGLLRYRFGIYRTPAGPGKTAEAGPGFRQGLWQTLGVEDGLPSSVVIHHWRTHGGAEVDLLLERDGVCWPLEIKCKTRITPGDARGIAAFRATYPSLRQGPGLIIAPVEQVSRLRDDVLVVPYDLG